MTHFEPGPNNEYYRMATHVDAAGTANLDAIKVLNSGSITEGMRRVVSLHRAYADCKALGGLLIAQTGSSLDVLSPPPKKPAELGEELELAQMTINVNPDVHDYLKPLTSPNNPTDLVDFWDAATGFYSDTHERWVLRQRFFRLMSIVPGKIAEVDFAVYFGEPSKIAQPSTGWRGLLGLLRKPAS
ncbi:MAG TPA: hypothetical protein VLE73_00575 [Candidatus Saccharimonadales bacterium]|nr:hypothetical protein [Candidatus Saccharimonadales bacterium]